MIRSWPSDIDASKGSQEEVGRIVTQIRKTWPKVRIILRADSGFARDALMDWCETNKIDYIFGLSLCRGICTGPRPNMRRGRIRALPENNTGYIATTTSTARGGNGPTRQQNPANGKSDGAEN
tara:strand:+ start:3431 stop:3799 length:369 start_codon:yes stop_codon:yes gene_type:complete